MSDTFNKKDMSFTLGIHKDMARVRDRFFPDDLVGHEYRQSFAEICALDVVLTRNLHEEEPKHDCIKLQEEGSQLVIKMTQSDREGI